MKSTLYNLILHGIIALILPFYALGDCTIMGVVNSNTNPFGTLSCSTGSGIVILEGTLNITSNYDISTLTGITEIRIADGGSINFTSNSTFNLPPDAIITLVNGSIIAPIGPGNGCNVNKIISFGGTIVAVCNGNGGLSFADVNGASGLSASGLLPIELLSFYATTQTSGITLNWQTATELENDYMAIERSRDGKNFEELGRRNGIGTSYEVQTYSFFDEKPFPGLNYYRLRQVDFDGTTSYHRVIAVVFGSTKQELSVFPTVAKEQVFIHWNKPLKQETIIQVIDISGRVLSRQQLVAETQSTSIVINQLVNGAYFLQIQSKNGVQTVRFIKN